jgi:hypothetical protein
MISVVGDVDTSGLTRCRPWASDRYWGVNRRCALDEAQKHPQKPERAAKIAQTLPMADEQPLYMGEIEVFSEFVVAL